MSTLSGACVLCVLVPHLMGSAGCSNDRQQAQRRLRRKSSGPKLRPGLNQPMRGPLNQMRIGQPRSQRLGAESSEAASLLAQVKRLVPDRRCLRRADSAPTEVASGRTRVRAKPGIRLLARNWLHRPKREALPRIEAAFARIAALIPPAAPPCAGPRNTGRMLRATADCCLS
jgi:hypothetical protein